MRNPKLIDKFALEYGVPTHILECLIEIADQRDLNIYLVGGPVRDLNVDRAFNDLDVAVEGDTATLAMDLADRLDGEADIHPPFLTATVRTDRWLIDLATTRSETYVRPGALPVVRPATIDDDLLRRDFTINAMAIRLNGIALGELLDPTGGKDDQRDRIIRALHENSFKDDPTRILRAARYEARFEYHIEPQTLELIRSDVSYLKLVSGSRVRREIERIFAEVEPERPMRRLDELGALRAIDGALSFNGEKARLFRAHVAHRTDSAPLWPLLVWDLAEPVIRRVCRHISLTKRQCQSATAVPKIRSLESKLASDEVRRSTVRDWLGDFPEDTVWALVAATQSDLVKQRCLDYLLNKRVGMPRLRGDDLIAIGVPAGPLVGKILRHVRNARLDKEVTSGDEEIRLIGRLLVDMALSRIVPRLEAYHSRSNSMVHRQHGDDDWLDEEWDDEDPTSDG